VKKEAAPAVTKMKRLAMQAEDNFQVESIDGFREQDVILIESDMGQEERIIKFIERDTKSLVLDEALYYTHPAGTVISQIAAPVDNFDGPQHTVTMPDSPRRKTAMIELFDTIDKDGDKRLDIQELLAVARLDGFQGTEAEWTQEFERLAKKWFPEKKATGELYGCSKEQFINMLNDQTDDGWYLTDDELRLCLDRLDQHQDHHGYLAPLGNNNANDNNYLARPTR